MAVTMDVTVQNPFRKLHECFCEIESIGECEYVRTIILNIQTLWLLLSSVKDPIKMSVAGDRIWTADVVIKNVCDNKIILLGSSDVKHFDNLGER